ncbi:MAG: carboxypeptidase regulatory-like domain-containing protein, partial [Candidatus Aminicenantes bacterium]|nr:carboxypeptidase regulatory-like domain-containing protein [Candidatus Aminicenantes bacterium]
MKYDYKNLIIVFTLVLLLVPLALQAQVTEGTLRGYVVDDTGEPLPGVTIEITSPSLMSARSQITDANGYFRFMFLPGGTYIICAKLDAFDVCWLKGIPITAAQTYTANVVMKQGVEEVTVEVTALAPVIDTESAAKTYNVTLSMMETIPLAARMNFSDVWMSLPGVADMYGDSPVINAGNITRDVEPGRSYFWSQHNQDDSYENKIMIDGMEVNDSMSGNSHAQINYEAIQEIDVKTAGAGAEYGNARSAFMNIITKSGGNDFQASFLFQYQPESLVGTNIEGGSPSATSYAIPAITLSGPIFKDKLWFLVSYKYDNENYTFPDTQIEPTIVRETRSHMPFAKLTWQAGNAHTMSFVYQDDYSVINNNNFPSYRYSTLDSAQVAKRGGPMTRLTWRWLASDSTYINFVAGY